MDELPNSESQWAIVELMGHKVVAGKVSKSEMMGGAMLRVDVPATDDYPGCTQFYGTAAIYAITFVSKEVARIAVKNINNNPVIVYMPELVTVEQMQAKEQVWKERFERIKEDFNRQVGLPYGGDFPSDEDDPELEILALDEDPPF